MERTGSILVVERIGWENMMFLDILELLPIWVRAAVWGTLAGSGLRLA